MATEDILALRLLVHAYCHRIDHGTADAIAGLFLPDGVLHLGFQPRSPDQAGRAAIRRWFAGYMAETRAASAHNRHRVGLLALEVSGAAAAASAWWDASGIRRSDRRIHLLRGHYRDRFLRVRGRWHLARREIHLTDQVTVDEARLLRPDHPPSTTCSAVWTATPT